MANLIENLTFYMQERGFTQKGLAIKAGLNETYVRDILKGNMENPSLPKLLKLCKALDVLPHDLMPEMKEFYPPEMVDAMEEMTRLLEAQRSVKAKIVAARKPKNTN